MRFVEVCRYSRNRCALHAKHSCAEDFQSAGHIRADVTHAEYQCGLAGNRLRMVVFLPDIRLFIAPVPSKRAVQRYQTANRVLRDDRAERTGRIRQHHALRQVFYARVLVRARQVFGLRQLGFTRFAENNRSRAKLLCGRVFAVLRERERALRAESGI